MKKNSNTSLILGPAITLFAFFPINNYMLSLLSIIVAYICISRCRACRKRENMFLFVLIPVITIPINIMCMKYIIANMNYIWEEIRLLKYIVLPVSYCMILSMEEIVLGIIGRIIWNHRQYSFWR